MVDRIKALAKEKKVSISTIEKSVGLGNGIIGKWKKQSPSCDKLKLVSDYLNTTIDYLLTGKEEISLSKNEKEKLNIFSKFNPIEQAKLIGKLEGLYRYKQIKESKQLEKSDTANININTKNINKTENSNDQEARIASRSINNDIPERSVVDDYSEVFDAPDATDKYK